VKAVADANVEREETERLAVMDAHRIAAYAHDVLAALATHRIHDALYYALRIEEHVKALEKGLNTLLQLEGKLKGGGNG
jgi:hypothetical protein